MMNAVFESIYNRTSMRSYSEEPIPDGIIQDLIKAGFHAANGLNTQKLRFSVVSNKAKLKEYSDRGKVLYLHFMKNVGIVHEVLEKNLNDPDFNTFYDAPSAIFIYSSPGIMTPVEDASLAAGNIMLAARSIGIGTCWIGLAAGLGSDAGFLKDNNVPEGHRLLAAIILGYPKDGFTERSERDEPTVLNWIR